MNDMGHNEKAVRLAALAGDAQIALDKVARGEADAFDGWLAYGHALNEGRALFPGDKEFGEWVSSSNLDERNGQEVHPGDRQAAMWGAANADQLAEAKAASNARTLRGWHDQWKKIEKEREKAAADAERKAKEEAERQARAEAARKAKEEAKAKEDEARAAAATAKDDEERKAAQEKADEAAKAAKDAEAKAQEAANADPEPAPDPYAKERKGLVKFTREGLEDELIETRIALAEKSEKLKAETARRRSAEKEVKALKEQYRQMAESRDLGPEVSRLLERVAKVDGDRKDERANAARLQRQVNAQAAEIKKLRKELEAQEVPL